MSSIDMSDAVRQGEELDLVAVEHWLIEQGILTVGPAGLSQYSGGTSNWTYRLKYQNIDLILRRPPAMVETKFKSYMVREYHIQQVLIKYYPFVPEMVALCQDKSVIGSEFYVMKHIEGIILRTDFPAQLSLNLERRRELCLNFIDRLIELHQVPYQATALQQYQETGDYCCQQIQYWNKCYQNVKTINVPSFKSVYHWLYQNLPTYSTMCLIHNDWRFDNMILNPQQPTQILAVLDWEMATVGDPLMDLGAALAYWVEASDPAIFKTIRRQPTHVKGMMTRQELIDYYLKKTGLKPKNWAFYEVYGIFRLAVIAQQMYHRYRHHPVFKDYWVIVHALHLRALKLIALNQLENNHIAQKCISKFRELMPK